MATATASNAAFPNSQATAKHFAQMLTTAFAPNPAAAVLAGGGLGIEVSLAATMPGHAIWSGGWASMLVGLFLVLFWVTAGWTAWFAARIAYPAADANLVEATSRRFSLLRGGWPLRGALLLAVAAAILLSAVSWGLFFQTNRFANWEAVRFTIANFGMLGQYLRAADAMQLVWLALIALALLVGVPCYGRWLRRSRWSMPASESVRRWRLGIWLMLVLAVSVTQGRVVADASLQRRVTRLDRFHNGVNPALTLAASAAEAWYAEPILPCLDVSELVPLEKTARGGVMAGVPGSGTTRLAQHAENAPLANPRRLPSVIIVAVEAMRHDIIHLRHQGREVTPNINRLAKAGLHLTRAYAQSTHSDYADVCLASSLYPLRSRHHHFYRREDPWPKMLLHDLLKPHGYATAIISSQNESWGGMDQFLQTAGLDWFYDPERSNAQTIVSERDPGYMRELQAGALYAGKFADRHTVDMALDWIGRHKPDRPFYLAMNFQSSHFPYILPDDCPQPFQPSQLDDDVKFSSYPKSKVPQVRNAYYNALAESDRQIGRLVERLESLGRLGDTILVVTGENGEAFHENGAIGHACNPVEPVVHVAAVLHAPALLAPRVEDYPFEHVDLAPTILGLLSGRRNQNHQAVFRHAAKLRPHPNFQGIDILSADRPLAIERLLFFHVLSPIARADAVLCGGRWKYMVSQDRPAGVLFDLQTDPTESTNVAAKFPERTAELARVLAVWRQRQLAYYHFPQYYSRFYPPRPPRLRQNSGKHLALQPSARLLTEVVGP